MPPQHIPSRGSKAIWKRLVNEFRNHSWFVMSGLGLHFHEASICTHQVLPFGPKMQHRHNTFPQMQHRNNTFRQFHCPNCTASLTFDLLLCVRPTAALGPVVAPTTPPEMLVRRGSPPPAEEAVDQDKAEETPDDHKAGETAGEAKAEETAELDEAEKTPDMADETVDEDAEAMADGVFQEDFDSEEEYSDNYEEETTKTKQTVSSSSASDDVAGTGKQGQHTFLPDPPMRSPSRVLPTTLPQGPPPFGLLLPLPPMGPSTRAVLQTAPRPVGFVQPKPILAKQRPATTKMQPSQKHHRKW